MDNINGIGGFSGLGRIPLTTLRSNLPGIGAPMMPVMPVDSINIGAGGGFGSLTESATDLLRRQSSEIISGFPQPKGMETLPDMSFPSVVPKQEAVPKYLSLVDDLQRDLTNSLPYGGEGSALGQRVDAWGENRDAALRELEGNYKERNFAMEVLGQRMAEIAREKQNLEQQLAVKQREEEEKKREAEDAKNDASNIASQDTHEIASKINNLEYEIRDKQTSVSNKEEEIADLKWEQSSNPEKKDEIQKKIDDLQTQADVERRELRQKEEEKTRLETEKREREAKEADDKKRKEELETKQRQLQDDITRLQEEENQIRRSIDDRGTMTGEIQDDISRKKQAADQLQWLISGFEYNTRGL